MRRVVSAALALVLALGVVPAAGQAQAVGRISGRATDEARRPYANYVVQVRDADSGQIVSSVPLDAQGRYEFTDLPLARTYLIELYNVRDAELICTEGPQALTTDVTLRENLHIDCGATPAALWLLTAAAGAVAAVGVVTQSASE